MRMYIVLHNSTVFKGKLSFFGLQASLSEVITSYHVESTQYTSTIHYQ